VRVTTLLRELLGLKQTVVVGFEFSETALVLDVKPTARLPYCGGCGRPAPHVHDRRERSWRHLDFAGLEVQLRYAIRRVDCAHCGTVTEFVPWAEPDSGFTRPFEEFIAYLAQRTDKTTIVAMTGIAWRTVGRIVERVVARHTGGDRLEGLRNIGIDELSYRRHHRYVTIVTDHERSAVVWVAEGKSADTLRKFFAELGPERAARLLSVTIDLSAAYIEAVSEAAPQAILVFDRFHVQRLAHDALDAVRREQVRELQGTAEGKALKKTRWALQKNPWNLDQPEQEKLSALARSNRPLYRAYLLKESLVDILDRRQYYVARRKLDEWYAWAVRSRLSPFCKLARTIRKHAAGILSYVSTRLSNAASEGINGKIRTITRRAYGFHRVASLVALIFLCCSNVVIDPPYRTPHETLSP
jgi:transposase